MAKLVGYGRVSADSQKENASLPAQKNAIKRYCELHGHKLIGYYEDVESGKTVEERENFIWALETMAEAAEGLIVYRLDRLTRRALDGERLKMTFQQQGKLLISVMESVDLETDDGSFVFTISTAIAELERKRILARCSVGREKKRETGGWLGGCPPYGYTHYKRTLIELPHEQKVCRMIREWHGFGWNTQTIIDELARRKIPAKKSLVWSMASVRRIIEGDPEVVVKLREAGQVLPESYWEEIHGKTRNTGTG